MRHFKWFDISLLMGLILAMALPLQASTYVWDTSPDPGYQAGYGFWDASVADWNADGTGTVLLPWTDGNDAVFSANGFSTVYTSPVSASSVTFDGTGYYLSGGTVTNTGDYVMNQSATLDCALWGKVNVRGSGTLTFSGGAYTTNRIIIANGNNTTGDVVQQGGDVIIANEWMMVGGNNNSGCTGTYTINGGSLDYGYGIYFGWGSNTNNATFIQNGGTVYSSDHVINQGLEFGIQGGNATYYLNGGTLKTYINELDSGQQHFVFGGGTLQWDSPFPKGRTYDLPSGMVTTISAAATAMIDTNGDNLNWLPAINGTGDNGLSKLGTGDLKLAPANSYTGETNVVNGQIIVTGNTSLGSGRVVTHWDLTNPIAPVGGGVDLNGCTLANKFALHGAGIGYGAVYNTSATAAEITGDVELGPEGEYIGGPTSVGNIKLSGTITGGVDSSVGGIYSFLKYGNITLTLSRPDNTFDGFVYIEQGVLEVTKLANKNAPSSLGQPTSDASNVLKFSNFYGNHKSGQTLRYIGSTASSTDRSIVLSYGAISDNIIDASGTTSAATVTFTGNAVFTPTETLPSTTMTLTGDNLGDNTIAGDIVGPVNLTKTGSGKWILSGTKSYTGDTLVNGGTLVADNIVHSTNVTVLSGTLTATSIVADTLTIGSHDASASAGVVTVPEPSTIALLLAAGLGLLFARRFGKK